MSDTARPGEPPIEAIEGRIASLLGVGAILAVGLLVVGVVLMLLAGISPDAAEFPVFDPSAVVADLVALRPEGFLWAGILVVIATPILRIVGEALGLARAGEGALAAVAVGILVVVLISVVIAFVADGATG